MGRSTPRVCNIILNWNNYPDTSECIESLQELSYNNFEIVVVDNGSTDGSGKRLRKEYDDVTVLFTNRNLGFAGGNNRGIREAMDRGADYVWILNDDIIIPDSECLNVLVERMESKSSIGVLTPLVTEYPETDELWFRAGYINWRSGNAGHVRSRRWFIEAGFGDDPITEGSLVYHDYLPLCSALVRTEIFEEFGLLNEEYFLYYEDVDLCSRISGHKNEIATETAVRAHHKVSASSDSRRSPIHLYYLTRNKLLFKKNFNEQISLLFYPLCLWWTILNLADQTIKVNSENLRAICLGFADGARGRNGRGRYPKLT